MPIFAFPFGSVIDVPTTRILARATAGTGPAEALTNTEIFAILGTGTPSASTYLRGDGAWATVSAGVGGSTGSTDNAVLRADGTGGATLQASTFVIPDNFTASPNATVNHASLQATGATTNVSVSIVPKGTGAVSLHVPDGTATGGNVRGSNAVDLQTSRDAATQVASGTSSALVGGRRGTASGSYAVSVGGQVNIASSQSAVVVGGDENTASGALSVVIGGYSNSATNNNAVAMGQYSVSSRANQIAHAGDRWSANGDCQSISLSGKAQTTTNAAVEVSFGPGIANAPTYITLAADREISGTLLIQGVRNGGADCARFCRHVTIKRVGATTTLVDSQTVGVDLASGTSVSLTADDTNDRLNISVTGVSGQTWRWNCRFEGIEQAIGAA